MKVYENEVPMYCPKSYRNLAILFWTMQPGATLIRSDWWCAIEGKYRKFVEFRHKDMLIIC
jgi:hypothetical protein